MTVSLDLRIPKEHLPPVLASKQGYLEASLTGRRMLMTAVKVGTWALTDMRMVCSHSFFCCRVLTFPVRSRFVFKVRGFPLLRCLW